MTEPTVQDWINAELLKGLRAALTCGYCRSQTMLEADGERWCGICGWPRPGYDSPPTELTGILPLLEEPQYDVIEKGVRTVAHVIPVHAEALLDAGIPVPGYTRRPTRRLPLHRRLRIRLCTGTRLATLRERLALRIAPWLEDR